ncbi:MAG: glycosyltransferase family 2 protein [Planctomycetota bacterium]|nr:glycosyltransferase family 2 protein [Planctomycetota bacterium]
MHEFITALPVFNEESHIHEVLAQVGKYSPRILVVNDGSRDGTAHELAAFPNLEVITHPTNQGYGAALRSAFDYCLRSDIDVLVTIDCDGQHEPRLIPDLVAALTDEVDIVSGSRYLKDYAGDNAAPADRRRINMQITAELNERLGLKLTDAFCGFKAYRVSALRHFDITDNGYAMPLQVWVQAVAAGLRIVEFPVPRVYLEEKRSFGGALDDASVRVAHYRSVLEAAIAQRDAAPVECSVGC